MHDPQLPHLKMKCCFYVGNVGSVPTFQGNVKALVHQGIESNVGNVGKKSKIIFFVNYRKGIGK